MNNSAVGVSWTTVTGTDVNLSTMQVRPPNVIFDPALGQIINLPNICSYVVDILQQLKHKSVLRLGLFNWMNANYYNNESFGDLIQYIVLVIEKKVKEQSVPLDPNIVFPICNECIEDFLGRFWSDNMLNFENHNFDQNQSYHIKLWVNRYQNNAAFINNYLNNTMSQMNRQGYNYSSPAQQNIYQPQYNNTNMMQRAVMHAGQASIMRPAHHYSNAVVSPNQHAPKNSRFNYEDKYQDSQQQVEQNVRSHNDVIAQKLPKHSNTWRASEMSPYLCALRQDQTFVFEVKDNFIKPVLIEDKESKMQMSDHFTTTKPIGQSFTEEVNSTKRTNSINNSGVSDQENIDKEITFNIDEKSDQHISDVNIESAMFIADISLRTMKKIDNRINAFRFKGIHVSPLVSIVDSNDFIESLGMKESFSQACSYLRRIKEEIKSNDCTRADEISFNFINNRLTQSVNDFIRKELALSYPYIDSFEADADSLLSYFQNKIGKTYLSALQDNQQRIIRRACEVLDKEKDPKKLMDEDYLSYIPSEYKPNTTYTTTSFNILAVDLFSSELCAYIPKPENGTDISVAVYNEFTPTLYKLAKSVLKYSEANGEEDYKNYIKTLDNVLIEVYPAAIQPQQSNNLPVLVYVK